MRVILIELLYVVLIAVAVGVLGSALWLRTPWGIQWRQVRNRRRAERGDFRCAAHGSFDETALVRLPTGERICPRCYEETA